MLDLAVKLNKKFDSRVSLKEVHGAFPYKYYVELIGANNIGRYIAIVGNEQLPAKVGDKISLEMNIGQTNSVIKSSKCFGKIVQPMEVKAEKFLVFEKE